jgi:hypothetical protein
VTGRWERAVAALERTGFGHMANEIGAYDDETVLRPLRALSRDEALAMVKAWDAAYSDLPVCVCNEDTEPEQCPYRRHDSRADCRPDVSDERIVAAQVRLLTQPLRIDFSP